MKYKGTITALVTPFCDQEIDEGVLIRLIQEQIEAGISGILVLGTTGEASTLSASERNRVIATAVGEAAGRVPIWVGVGSTCTRQTVERAKEAQDLGADVALVVTPYYNKPSQEGIYRHFEAVAAAIEIPIVLYNIPGRCGVNVETSTLVRIAGLPNVVGVKECSGNIHQAADAIHTIGAKYPDFSVFAGDDAMIVPLMALGAVGGISVVSNLIPDQVIALTNAMMAGQMDLAREIHFRLLPLYKAAFIETNPVPIKTAMNLCGMSVGECRLPLCQMMPENVEYLHRVLTQIGLTTACKG